MSDKQTTDWREEVCRLRHALQEMLTWCAKEELSAVCLDDAQDILNREAVHYSDGRRWIEVRP